MIIISYKRLHIQLQANYIASIRALEGQNYIDDRSGNKYNAVGNAQKPGNLLMYHI